jgi:hypothetical protein
MSDDEEEEEEEEEADAEDDEEEEDEEEEEEGGGRGPKDDNADPHVDLEPQITDVLRDQSNCGSKNR